MSLNSCLLLLSQDTAYMFFVIIVEALLLWQGRRKLTFIGKPPVINLGYPVNRYPCLANWRSVIFEILFWCLQLLPKTERKQVHKSTSSKVEFVCLFFGRNVGLKKSFRICLTFKRSVSKTKVCVILSTFLIELSKPFGLPGFSYFDVLVGLKCLARQ